MHWNSHDKSRNQVCCIWAPHALHHEIHEFWLEFFMNFEFFEVLPNTEDIAFSADIGLFDIVDMCYSILPVSNSKVPWDCAFKHLLEIFCPRRCTTTSPKDLEVSLWRSEKIWSQHSKNPWDTHLPLRGSGFISSWLAWQNAAHQHGASQSFKQLLFVKWCLIYLMPDFTYSNFDFSLSWNNILAFFPPIFWSQPEFAEPHRGEPFVKSMAFGTCPSSLDEVVFFGRVTLLEIAVTKVWNNAMSQAGNNTYIVKAIPVHLAEKLRRLDDPTRWGLLGGMWSCLWA